MPKTLLHFTHPFHLNHRRRKNSMGRNMFLSLTYSRTLLVTEILTSIDVSRCSSVRPFLHNISCIIQTFIMRKSCTTVRMFHCGKHSQDYEEICELSGSHGDEYEHACLWFIATCALVIHQCYLPPPLSP
jgi:hypothetical protein